MGGFAIDHVQIAIPAGGEDSGRAFFGTLLGLSEIPKPLELRGRGGAWFDLGSCQIHLGVDSEFRPARKAHVALETDSLETVRARLLAAGHQALDEPAADGRARFFTFDPFGNRLEFVERAR